MAQYPATFFLDVASVGDEILRDASDRRINVRLVRRAAALLAGGQTPVSDRVVEETHVRRADVGSVDADDGVGSSRRVRRI